MTLRSTYDPAFPASWSIKDIDDAKRTWTAQGREIKQQMTRNRIVRKHQKQRKCLEEIREKRDKFNRCVSDYVEGL